MDAVFKDTMTMMMMMMMMIRRRMVGDDDDDDDDDKKKNHHATAHHEHDHDHAYEKGLSSQDDSQVQIGKMPCNIGLKLMVFNHR